MPLRERLRQVWSQSGVDQVEEEVKRFPIRILNAGVKDTLLRAGTLGLNIPPDIEAIAYELEAVRNTVTSIVTLQHRPNQPSTGANKHFFALEYLESRFMVAFLQEIRKRARCASLIWLHDGLWVPKDLCDSLLLSCEQIAAKEVFPTLPEWLSILRIQGIPEPQELRDHPVLPRSNGYLFPPPPYRVLPRFTSHHPKPRLTRKRVGGGLASTFHSRMYKTGSPLGSKLNVVVRLLVKLLAYGAGMAHAIELDHLSCDELRKLACRVERRLLSLTEQTAEGKSENPYISGLPSAGSDDPKTARDVASPTAGSVTRPTLSEKVQDLIYMNDPWEGSGVGPTKWSRPFYSGNVIRPANVPGHFCERQCGPELLPVFGGPPCSNIGGHDPNPTGMDASANLGSLQLRRELTCTKLCAICYSPCCLSGFPHGLHACERHKVL